MCLAMIKDGGLIVYECFGQTNSLKSLVHSHSPSQHIYAIHAVQYWITEISHCPQGPVLQSVCMLLSVCKGLWHLKLQQLQLVTGERSNGGIYWVQRCWVAKASLALLFMLLLLARLLLSPCDALYARSCSPQHRIDSDL